jgi:hypothetical protein
MTGWQHAMLFAGVVMSTIPADTPGVSHAPMRHDFHVSYTRMAIESTVISAQIRLFSDDLTRALVARSRTSSLTLDSTQGEAAFQAYAAEQFPVLVSGRRLTPVVASGAKDGEMWSYVLTWTSPTPITAVSMHNAALFEFFDDQQNIVKIKHIATGKEATLFYSGGSKADQVFRF